MVRPTAAQGSQEESREPTYERSGVDPIHSLTNLEQMFGSKQNEDSDDDRHDDRDDREDHSGGDQDGGYDYSFDDRSPEQASREALRRARRTQEAVESLYGELQQLKSMMQTGGSATATPDLGDFSFSKEDRELINEAMQKDPATALEILQRQMISNARKYADSTVESRIARDNAKREAERDVARIYPQIKNPTHPFRRAVTERLNTMRNDYRRRGMDPDALPELVKYAAQEVAMSDPNILGNGDRRTDMREESRRRGAERITSMNRTRSSTKKDDLPELSDQDLQRGSRMGLNMNDPHVRKSLQMRRRYYEDRRR